MKAKVTRKRVERERESDRKKGKRGDRVSNNERKRGKE